MCDDIVARRDIAAHVGAHIVHLYDNDHNNNTRNGNDHTVHANSTNHIDHTNHTTARGHLVRRHIAYVHTNHANKHAGGNDDADRGPS